MYTEHFLRSWTETCSSHNFYFVFSTWLRKQQCGKLSGRQESLGSGPCFTAESLSNLEQVFSPSFCSSVFLSVMKESKSKEAEPEVTWIWRWRKGSWAKKCRRPLEVGKDKERDPPLEPPEGMQPCKPILDSDFEDCEIINRRYFKAIKFVVIIL